MNAFHIRRLKEETPPSTFSKAIHWIRRLHVPTLLVIRHIQNMLAKRQKGQKRRRIVRSIAYGAIIVVVAVCGIGIGVKALVSMNILRVSQIMDVAGTPLPTDDYGHTNFLLLGQGDETHDGVDLTDTIILASLDARGRSAAMISIPRDLYLSTTRMGSGRVNALYRNFKYWLMKNEGMDADAAGDLAMRELADELGATFGIQLHHVVKVDFIAFIQAVDALDGIDIDVPEDLYDPEYPGPNYTYETFSVLQGRQHMDGETALKYARSRHSTSDFDRSRRQQDIIQALGEKAKNAGLSNPQQLTSLLRIVEKHVATTLTFREMVTLAQLGSRIDRSKIVSAQFNLEGPGGFLYPPPRDQFGGAAVLIPNSWDEVRTFMNLVLTERPLFLDEQPIDVFNAGGPPGAAGMLARELDRYTLPIGSVANYDGDKREASTIITPRSRANTAKTLSTLLRIPDVVTAPETSTGTSIQILLGKEYYYRSIAELSATSAINDQP